MGLFDKTNPRATFGSVIRHAAVVGGTGAVLYAAANWNAGKDRLTYGLLAWTVLCAAVGAVWEWQVVDRR